MMQKSKKFFLLFFILFLFCTGCAKQPTISSDEVQAEVSVCIEDVDFPIYHLKSQTIPNPDNALNNMVGVESDIVELAFGMSTDTIYRVVRVADSDFIFGKPYIQILKAPYTKWECKELAEDNANLSIFVCANVDKTGEVSLLQSTAEGLMFGVWTETEGFVTSHKIRNADVAADLSLYQQKYCTDEDGGIYFHRYQMPKKVQMLNAQLQDTEITLEEMASGLFWDTVRKEMLCLSNGEQGYGLYTFTGENVYKLTNTGKNCFGYLPVSETASYFANEEGILLWNDGAEIKEVCSFLTINYVPEQIVSMNMNGQGMLQLLVREEGEIGLLTLYEGENIIEKKELTLAVKTLDAFWKKQIATYNKQSEKYHVTVIEDGFGEDALTKKELRQTQVATGKGPDLMESYTVDFQVLAEKKCFLDLGNELNEEFSCLLNSAIKDNSLEDYIYAAPINCSLDTMLVYQDMADNRQEWTLEETIEAVKSSKAPYIFPGSGADSIVCQLAMKSEKYNSFINYDKGICSFNSDEFIELMKFAKEYADPEVTQQDGVKVQEKTAIAYSTVINDVLTVNWLTTMFNGEESYIGYPTDGGSGHFIQTTAIAINKATPNVEGCIDFIQYLLSEDVQNGLAEEMCRNNTYGFPTRIDSLEAVFREHSAEKSVYVDKSFMGITSVQEELSTEKRELLMNLFNEAEPYNNRNSAIRQIICDEMQPFVASQRSAEKTAEVIQNRVQLYLDEQK